MPPLASTGKLGRIAASQTTGGWWMRWAPTLAAALVLLATGAMFYVNFLPPMQHSGDEALSGDEFGKEPSAHLTDLQLELADTRRQVKRLREQLDRTLPSGAAGGGNREEDGVVSTKQADRMPAMGGRSPAPAAAPGPTEEAQPDDLDPAGSKPARGPADVKGSTGAVDSGLASGPVPEEQEPMARGSGVASRQIDEALEAGKKVEGLSEEVTKLRKQVDKLQETNRIALARVDKLSEAAEAREADENRAAAGRRRTEGLRLKATDEAKDIEKFGQDEMVRRREVLQDRIDQLERKTKRLEAALSVSYRMAAADGRQGLAGWQIAAARSELARRAGLVRPSASGEKTAKLIDRIEFVLLRLEQVGPEDPAARKSLSEMIGEGKLIEMIDERIDSQSEAAKVEAWLLEARVILEGVNNVG